MRPVIRRALVSLAWLLAFMVVLIIDAGGLSFPIRYELPSGYRGWVVLQTESPNCPPMRWMRLYRSVQLDNTGYGCTSSKYPNGWHWERLVYVERGGRQVEIPIDGSRNDVQILAGSFSDQTKKAKFFVGTEDDLQHSWRLRPKP